MPPHPHHHHGGHGGGPGFIGWIGGNADPTVIVTDPGCLGYDLHGRPVRVPCTDVLGADDVPESDGATANLPEVAPLPPIPIMRTAFNLSAGRKAGGSTPYYRFAAQARSYPFDWHGRPGGVPAGHRAGETNELSGADLLESGLNPYARAYPPMAHRGFRPPGALGALTDLSANEKILALGAVAAGAALLFWKSRKRRR